MKRQQSLLICVVITFCFYGFINSMGPVLPLPSPDTTAPESQKTESPANLPAEPENVELSEEKIGLQGNWVKKREWLIEAQKVTTEIQDILVAIQKGRKGYYDKYVTIEDELDTFYKGEGFSQGKLAEIFAGIEKYLEKKKKKELEKLKAVGQDLGVTSDIEIKTNLVEEEIKAHRTDLEQLRLDMQSVNDLDKSLSERLKKLDEQINIAQSEASRASEVCNEIWYMIDDKKARANFYELKGNILEKIKAIQVYVLQDLFSDFDKVLEVIRSQEGKVKEGIKNLEEKGFIIKERAQRIEQIKLKELEQSKAEKEAEAALKGKGGEQAKGQGKIWYQRWYDGLVDAVASVYSFFSNLNSAPSK